MQLHPTSAFDYGDLLCNFHTRHYGGKHKDCVVMLCSIPTNLILLLVLGEKKIDGTKCHFVRTKSLTTPRNQFFCPRKDNTFYVHCSLVSNIACHSKIELP